MRSGNSHYGSQSRQQAGSGGGTASAGAAQVEEVWD